MRWNNDVIVQVWDSLSGSLGQQSRLYTKKKESQQNLSVEFKKLGGHFSFRGEGVLSNLQSDLQRSQEICSTLSLAISQSSAAPLYILKIFPRFVFQSISYCSSLTLNFTLPFFFVTWTSWESPTGHAYSNFLYISELEMFLDEITLTVIMVW